MSEEVTPMNIDSPQPKYRNRASHNPPIRIPNTYGTTLAYRIRLSMKNREITVARLAKISGVGQRTIYRIRLGETEHPHYDILGKLSEALRVPHTWLESGLLPLEYASVRKDAHYGVYNENKATFGEKVRYLRIQKRWRQEDLGEKLGGVKKPRISDWERGATMPRKYSTLHQLALVLGYPLEQMEQDIAQLKIQRVHQAFANQQLKESDNDEMHEVL